MDVPTLMHNLKEEVSCSVCMQLYKEPKQLPCLHVFCLECLNNIARTSARHDKIKCPLCQIEVAVPESGTMETLPSCFYLKNLLDILAIKECSTSRVTCGNCEKKSEEASYCFHCGGFWCNFCLDAHNILRPIIDHRVLALKDFQERDFEVVLKRPAFCQKELHEKEVLKFYCKMCEIPVCQNCRMVEHGKHDVEYLEVTARAAKQNMAAQLEAAEKETQTFSDCMRELEEKSCRIDERSQFVKRQIQDAVKSLILNLQQREHELITEVEKEAKIEQDRVTKDKTKISEDLKKIEDAMSQAKHFIDCSTAAELVRAKTFVRELLEVRPAPELIASASQRETNQTVFVKNKTLFESLQNEGIGRLDNTATKANQCSVEGFNEATAGLETRFKFITRNADRKQSYSPGDRVVVELASTEDGTLAGDMKIVHKNNGNYEVSCIPKREGEHKVTARVNGEEISDHQSIHVEKRSYKLVRTVNGEGTGAGEFDRPWGVAVNDKNEIIVCDYNNDRLQVFNENGDFIRTIEHELLTLPRGICIDSAGRIYVATYNKILLFNPNGDYIKEIGDEENQDAIWYGISLDEQGNVIVCNQKDFNQAVHILSPEGKLLKKLTRDDFTPYDCLYYERKIFVSNWATHTIDVFYCEGNFLREIGTGGIENGEFCYPVGLAIDKTGHLVVSDDNGVQVFTLDGKFVTKFESAVFSDPRGVSVLKDGRIIVTNLITNQLLIFE
ncbi:E3 ubiquitin-protein ligase TRIM71-like [Oculina patagonica]